MVGMLTGAIVFFGGHAAQATTLTAATNIDNKYEIFISTNDSVAGTSFGSGFAWPTTFIDSTPLTSGVTNYMHILAIDTGFVATLLGEFTLSDSGFEFANGTQSMLSGDAGLLVSLSGFGSGYTATTDQGPNGTSPWGSLTGVDASARFVWSSDSFNHNQVYFSAAINPVSSSASVPEPTTLALLALGLTGIGFGKRRKSR